PAEGIAYRVPTTGNYFVRVMIGTTSTGITGAGDYLLSISKNCAAGGGGLPTPTATPTATATPTGTATPTATATATATATPTATATGTATPTPTPCTPSWAAGPNFPLAGAVRDVGVYFPANG